MNIHIDLSENLCIINQNRYNLFQSTLLPNNWIVEDKACRLWLLDCSCNSWERKIPFVGNRRLLTKVPIEFGLFLGIPDLYE